jgi:D-alanyl-D-alanine dipeptidase
MTRHGFLTYPDEWWHFDFKGWEKYQPLSIGFQEFVRSGDILLVP